MVGQWTIKSAAWRGMIIALVALSPLGCDKKPASPLSPDQQAEQTQSAATRPAAQANSAIEIHDALAPVRKRAEAGDAQAMITLGRAFESLGGEKNRASAREWYRKAAAAGEEDAALSLKMLDATSQPGDAGSATGSTGASGLAAAASTTLSKRAVTPATGGDASAAGDGAGGSGVAPASTAPADLTKTNWNELLATIDTKEFVTIAKPEYRKHPQDPPQFVGLSTAPDKTLTIAATGPGGGDLMEVSLVMRVRNQQDLANNLRVRQASVIANMITRNNVAANELTEWIRAYLASGVKSDPVFRNGWRIVITGTAGEGVNDPKSYLGQAVLVEMKK
jgi:hypothetical protein